MPRLIGFSTGCFKNFGWSYGQMVDFCLSLGVEAMEISFPYVADLQKFRVELRQELFDRLRRFKHLSWHAPWKDIAYGENSPAYTVARHLEHFSSLSLGSFSVIHPDLVNDFSWLKELNSPLVLENMDGAKERGVSAGEFAAYQKETPFGFVLDLQHVYEHDHSLRSVSRFVRAMGSYRLAEIHLSGQLGSERHTPVFYAENREKVLAAAGKIPRKTPIILEGSFSDERFADDFARKELAAIESV